MNRVKDKVEIITSDASGISKANLTELAMQDASEFIGDINAGPSAESEREIAAIVRRVGKQEDLAHAVVFFASGQSSSVTGQRLSVSGGFAMVG